MNRCCQSKSGWLPVSQRRCLNGGVSTGAGTHNTTSQRRQHGCQSPTGPLFRVVFWQHKRVGRPVTRPPGFRGRSWQAPEERSNNFERPVPSLHELSPHNFWQPLRTAKCRTSERSRRSTHLGIRGHLTVDLVRLDSIWYNLAREDDP